MKSNNKKLKAIKFNFNAQKALEVIVWIAGKKTCVDVYCILKTLFFADYYHLNKYGRTISGDSYKALPYGPVASGTYDILNEDSLAIEMATENSSPLPFRKENKKDIKALRKPNLDMLSKSDIEALEHGWETVKKYDFDFNQIKNKTHEYTAYKKAWARRGLLNTAPMDFTDFLEKKSKKMELAQYSHLIKI